MTADNDDLEDFIRLQKEKLSKERHGFDDSDKSRKQWDRSNQDQIKQSVKENIPVRSDTPEVPIAAKLGQHEETRKRLAEEKRKEYNDLVSRQGGTRRNRKVSVDNGGVLPGLRDSQSAKQRKVAERNREYNDFLKSQKDKGRRGQPLNERGNEGMSFPSEQPARREAPRAEPRYRPEPTQARPTSRNRASSPIDHLRNGVLVPNIDLGHSNGSRDYGPFPEHQTGGGKDGGSSLPIDDRAAELKRKEEERNREYNDFLKQQGNKRGRQREPSPSDAETRRRARSVGAPQLTFEEPKRGWGTPRYDDVLETKRFQEASYRQGAFAMRPAVSEGALDQVDETRKLDRLDDVFESRKVRFKSELYNGARRPPRVALDDDEWLDFYKSPSRYSRDFDGISRAHTTLDADSFQAKAERVRSAPLREQAFIPTRPAGAVATSKDQYRLELEQQMKSNAENRRREKMEGMAVNASGLTEITRQNVDMNRRGGPAQTAPTLLDGNILSASGQATLGPYNSPMDEAYYFYSRRDPLDVGPDVGHSGGYVPSVPGTGAQYAPRRSVEEPKSRVTFGPAPNLTPRRKNDSDLVTVAAIPIVTEDDQRGLAKQKTNNYQAELQRQIEENKMRKNMDLRQQRMDEAKLEAEIAGYNPFGKGGGGAPLKDTQGNVFADLKRMHVSNLDDSPARGPTKLPVTTNIDIPMSVYDAYLSPRQPQQQFATPRKTNAFEEPTFARGGHGIFGDPKSDAEKSVADRYKIELQLQIEEKKRREEEKKAQLRAEEERELRQIEEARLKMQREYEEEVRKQREKEENNRRRNEDLKQQAEEKRREAERLRRDHDDRRTNVPSRTLQELDRERVRLTLSPPVPSLRIGDELSARRSPPVPALRHSPRDVYEPRATTRLDRAGSADVLNKLEVIRKQLQSERQRVENQLEKDKYEVDVFDPRLVKAAAFPMASVPVIMSPPLVLSPAPRRSPEIDVFDTAALHKAPVTVKRPAVEPVNADLLNEFNQYKNRDTDSRHKFRQLFPDQPVTGGALETQQLALLRHQEDQLNSIRTDPQPMGSKTMLKSESAYIDTDGLAVKPETARERRRKKRVQVESPKSSRRPSLNDIGSTTSLNSDMNKKNEGRLKKLRDMNDDDSLQDPDDILDRFMSRQQHQRPNSGTTLNDDEAWLRPSN